MKVNSSPNVISDLYNNINYEYNIQFKNIHIINSYFVTCDKTKIDFINYFINKHFLFITKRKMKSFLREWEAHNIFYQHGWYVNRTKDADLEANIKWYKRIAYWLICLLFKEKKQ